MTVFFLNRIYFNSLNISVPTSYTHFLRGYHHSDAYTTLRDAVTRRTQSVHERAPLAGRVRLAADPRHSARSAHRPRRAGAALGAQAGLHTTDGTWRWSCFEPTRR